VRYVGGRWEEILAGMQRFQAVLIPAVLLLAASALLLYLWRRRVRAPRR